MDKVSSTSNNCDDEITTLSIGLDNPTHNDCKRNDDDISGFSNTDVYPGNKMSSSATDSQR